MMQQGKMAQPRQPPTQRGNPAAFRVFYRMIPSTFEGLYDANEAHEWIHKIERALKQLNAPRKRR
jgi:hypothetical protein